MPMTFYDVIEIVRTLTLQKPQLLANLAPPGVRRTMKPPI